VSGKGFRKFFERLDEFDFRSAQEYRQRHIIQAMKGMMQM
jgi:hypothetical protein